MALLLPLLLLFGLGTPEGEREGEFFACVPELRIFVCVAKAGEKEWELHIADKERHETNLESAEQADIKRTAGENPPHLILNDVCAAAVEKDAIGPLYRSWPCKERNHREETELDPEHRQRKNRECYKAIADRTSEYYDLMPGRGKRKCPVILDVDAAVPFEHVIGIRGALRAVGIENIEFAVSQKKK